jgi:hypothetical protein
MNRYRMFFVQTSTLPPRMHHKLTKHGRFCKQNNQLPTKSHVEFKDNSIISLILSFGALSGENCQLVIDDLVEVRDFKEIMDHFRGIYKIYLK